MRVRAAHTLGLAPLRVGATPVPYAEILDHVRPALAERGIDLQIEIFETFDEPNDQLVAKRLHANFFQYLPFLRDFNRRTGSGLIPVVPVHIEPFGLYSNWFADVDALPEYAEVVLPSDSVNVDRSLTMLHRLGLIDCTPAPGELATVSDVRANQRNMVFKELTSWLLGDVREDFDADERAGSWLPHRTSSRRARHRGGRDPACVKPQRRQVTSAPVRRR